MNLDIYLKWMMFHHRVVYEMLKAIKIRLYPTEEQQGRLNSLMGSCRFVYNSCLSYKMTRYEVDKVNTTMSMLSKYFHGEMRNEFGWLKEHNTKVIKQSIIDLETAYKNFFKHGKGFPRFKTKHDEQKVRFPQEAVSSKTFDESSSRLNLTKTINGLRFKCSDRDRDHLYKNCSGIRSITITRKKCGHYYASVLIDGEMDRDIPEPINHSVGIDLGIKTLITFSNDTPSIENPKWIRNAESKLIKLQKRVSKKKKGSKNRHKAIIKLARQHEKIKNQKNDFLHNITTKLIIENQVICLEDLNISGMLKNHKLAKAIQELSLGEMRRQIEYKASWYGRVVVFVDRFYPSSKTCSCCGWKNVNLKLSDRDFTCQDCGLNIDRDKNASVNVEIEGLRVYNYKIGLRVPESSCVNRRKLEDCPIMDERSEMNLRSNGRLRQEDVNFV